MCKRSKVMMNRFGYWLAIAGILVGWNCVGPEDPTDGLLEDLPSVVNTTDVFTFTLKGNKFSFDESYDLAMKPDSNSVISTSLIVSGWSGNDTSKIFFINSSDTTYAWLQILGNMTYTSVDSLTTDTKAHPAKLLFTGTELTGTIQFSLIKD